MSSKQMIAVTLVAAFASPCMPGLAAQTMEPAQRDAQCLVALRAETRGELDNKAARFFHDRVSKGREPELVELLILSAQEAILPNANRREIASTCELLYQVIRLQENRASGGEESVGSDVSPNEQSDAANEQPSWRTVALPAGGELRYIPPLPTAADYPAEAKTARLEGTTMTRLTINPAGRIVSCEIANSAGLAALDASACRLYVNRSRFELRDVSEPVTMLAPVVWKLED